MRLAKFTIFADIYVRGRQKIYVMYRQIIVPQNTQLTLTLPMEFVGQQVEVIAFPLNDVALKEPGIDDSVKREQLLHEAFEFYKKHAVDFSKIKKWKREDLYD